MIPKIIHQTWKTKDVPKITIPWIESWKRLNPDWEYRFWTDEDNLKLCQEEFPELLYIYTSYQFDIQRADVARYMILYQHGGLYADIDTECFRPVDALFKNVSIGLFKWLDIITNYIISAKPKMQFFMLVLNSLNEHFIKSNKSANMISTVINTTGPGFLYSCYVDYRHKIELLDIHPYLDHYGLTTWNRGNFARN